MTSPTDLLALAGAVEADDGEGIYDLFDQAMFLLYPDVPDAPERVRVRSISDRARIYGQPLFLLGPIVMMVPEGWDKQGNIMWPGREDGYYKAPYRANLHHDISSGGGPRVSGFGVSAAHASLAAVLRAHEAILRAHAGREG